MTYNSLGTDELQRAVDAVTAYGGIASAARALGIPRTTFQHRVERARQSGFKSDAQSLAAFAVANPDLIASPPSNAVPEGMRMRGVSTRVDGNGETDQQWIKTERDSGELFQAPAGFTLKGVSAMTDAEGKTRITWQKYDADAIERLTQQEALVKALMEKIEPLPLVAAPLYSDCDLCTLYTMTDCHVGMLAWEKETGADWDLGIAERVLTQTLLNMIASAPASEVGILNELGDFLHFDSLMPLTPTNHHVLDADSRYQKIVMVAVRIIRRVIQAMLEKHSIVHVEIKEGNHDPAGSVWMRIMFSLLYANEPRITIGMSPNPYTVYQFSKTFLGFYHGHLAKKLQLPLIFAAQFAKEWGETQHRYIHTGHLHHVEEKEHPGIRVIQHPTLAAPDAYAARGGWLSKRQATSMTYHREYGEYARGVFIPQGV